MKAPWYIVGISVSTETDKEDKVYAKNESREEKCKDTI